MIKALARAEDIKMPNPILAANSERQNRLRRNGPLRKAMTVFPLLVPPIGIYMMMALFSGDGGIQGSLDTTVFNLSMLSGARWELRAGDLLSLFALLMLSIEIVKSTNTKSGAIANHAASMGLLLFCLIGFLVFRSFATSVFFLITMMCLLDVLAGVMVTIVSARRDFGVGDGFGG
jgi:hypothetical protein